MLADDMLGGLDCTPKFVRRDGDDVRNRRFSDPADICFARPGGRRPRMGDASTLPPEH